MRRFLTATATVLALVASLAVVANSQSITRARMGSWTFPFLTQLTDSALGTMKMVSSSATNQVQIPNGSNLEYAGCAWATNVWTCGTTTNGGTNRAMTLTSDGTLNLSPSGANNTVVNSSLFVTGAGKGFGAGSIGVINTAPTISSGFGTSPSVPSSNSTATFRVNVGTGGVATSGVVGMPTATTGWNCQVTDTTNNTVTRETATATTTVTVTAASAWAASDILIFNCWAY